MRENFVGNRQLLSQGLLAFNLDEHSTSTHIPFLEHIQKLQGWAVSWMEDDDMKEVWLSTGIPIGYGSQADIANGRRLLPLGFHGSQDPRLDFEEDRIGSIKGYGLCIWVSDGCIVWGTLGIVWG